MKSDSLAVCIAILFCVGALAPASIGAEEGQGAKVPAITLPQTGQTKSYAMTDDANLHKGASWPKPRFKVNDDETVTDNLTGLVWTKTARNPGPPECVSGKNPDWNGALKQVACLNTNKYLGFDNWRLPNINELESLINTDNANSIVWLTAQGFRNVMMEFYWSSTTDSQRPEQAWVAVMYSGNVLARDKYPRKYPVWPVRSAKNLSGGAVSLPQTGQKSCYGAFSREAACKSTGQDGETATGVSWPNPRFSVAGECVTDNLTGLTWAKNPEDRSRTWEQALMSAKGLSLCGYSDWRLPNRNELRSLVNYGQAKPANWLNGQGFGSVKADDYWTSTSYEDRVGNAWVINFEYGHVVAGRKDKSYYVLPVRGGQ